MQDVPHWFPRDEGLQEICGLLAEYQTPSADHAHIYQRIEEYCTQPEFSNYLAYLLAHGSNFPSEVRQCAGLLLKNKIRPLIRSLPDENLGYIQGSVMQALSLQAPCLRQTAGTVVAAIVRSTGLSQQVPLIEHLTQLLSSNEQQHKEGALDAIFKICEDCPEAFEPELVENAVVVRLIFLIIQHFVNESVEIRRLALAVMNILIPHISSSQDHIIQKYREELFGLNSDSEPRIRKEVCYGMTQLITFHQEYTKPFIQGVIHFMLECTQHSEASIAMESCEFWMAFVDASLEPRELLPRLGELLPVLLNNMVYEDDDDAVITTREAEEESQDQDSNLRPFMSGESGMKSTDLDADVCQTWTLRKCSAAGLDKLSTMFGNDLLHHVLPLIQERTRSPDWKHRECAILVLGAISDGCRDGLHPMIEEVLSEILPRTEDPDPLVRIIACWALGRYAHWVIDHAYATQTAEERVTVIFEAVLKTLHDPNKQVQLAACSSLATMEECAGAALLPRLGCILEHLAVACRQYGRRNLRMAYDAIGILAERVGTKMALPEYRQVIMPPLLELYDRLGNDDKELQPLFSCLAVLATSFGSGFQDYVVQIYQRAIVILNTQLELSKTAESGSPPTDGSFVVSALDLVSGLVEGMGASMEPLIEQSRLGDSVFLCCHSTEADVRQSAFALLGELAKICPSHIRSHITQFCHLCVENFAHEALSHDALSACNNACWALGEMALHCTQEELQPIALKTVENCVNILVHARCLPRSLAENAAITTGRLALVSAPAMAPYLSSFLGIWCEMLRNIRDDVEKEQAFTGLFKSIALNLNGALHAFPSVCGAVASWNHGMPDALKKLVLEGMENLKRLLESKGEWEAVWALVQPPVQEKLLNPAHW